MARLTFITLAVAALIGAGTAVAQGTARATLHVTVSDGIHVRGTHFRPRERIRLSVTYADATKTRVVRATATGAFASTVPEWVPYDPCVGSLVATAVGNSGDRASIKLPQRACPPPA